MDGMKRCSKCGEVKELACFASEARQKDGRSRWCKACKAESARQWFLANPARHAANVAVWKRTNREKVRAKDRRLAQAHPERDRERTRRNTVRLADCYVAARIGAPIAALPPQLINLKREQLLLLRLARELKQELEKHHGD